MGLVGGSGEDWATARRGARSALAPPIICGSVISPARETTPVPAISPVWDFAPLPTIFGVSPRSHARSGACRPCRLLPACARSRLHDISLSEVMVAGGFGMDADLWGASRLPLVESGCAVECHNEGL